MPPIQYKLHSVGSQVAGTATAPHYVHVIGVAKAATAESPYTVSNELICGQLARAIGLPTPPGFLVTARGALHYVSLDFNLAGATLPPVDVVAFVAYDSMLASGILVFDAWVVNLDRHHQNFAFDTTTKQTNVFDHSHAFLGWDVDGRQHLESHRTKLGIGGHAIAPHVTQVDGIRRWIDRVQSVPRYMVEDAVDGARGTGISDAEATYCVDFLMDRGQRLPDLFRGEQARFTAIQGGLWQTF